LKARVSREINFRVKAVAERDFQSEAAWAAGSGSRGAIGLLDVSFENAIKDTRG
jgi:hypothetical protein